MTIFNAENEGIASLLEQILTSEFRLSRVDGTHIIEPIRFGKDGSVFGNAHKNETNWDVIDGKFSFISSSGKPSTIFTSVSHCDGKIEMVGAFLLKENSGIFHKLELIKAPISDKQHPPSLTNFKLADKIKKYGWCIGDHTYGSPKVLESGSAKLSIGKFCSIAGNVVIILANHRIDTVTTYPFHALRKYWKGANTSGLSDHSSNGDITIGNDVWIGYGACIMSGVTIGDGAVIAANSLVNKDVPPYSVVGVTPAKIIRKRHSDEIISSLLTIKWWNWDDEVVDAHIPLLLDDAEKFVELVNSKRIKDK